MFEPKLLRRPLPPKVERERLTPKRKSYKGVIAEAEEPLRGYGIFDDHHQLAPLKTQQPICQSFPDYDLRTKLLVPLNRSFVLSPQPSGPPSFPSQKRPVPSRFRISVLKRYPLHFVSGFMLQGLAALSCLPPKFLTSAVKTPTLPPTLSRVNYEVLTSELIAEERRGPQRVAHIYLTFDDFPYIRYRKPVRQRLLERMFEQKMLFGEEKEEEGDSIPDEEKRLLEKKKKKRVTYAESVQELGFAASLISGIAYKPHVRSEDEESQLTSKAEMAVLSCLTHRRTGLSLKAFFLSQLPDLSPLADFLLYLNLSYNFLDVFPEEVYCLIHLEILKLRSNPIRFIPEEISQMTSLKYLVMSFNLLTTLPLGLFALPNLEGLDVSYNELETIPDDIRNLSKLTYLNAEGNLLHFLPCGILKLPMTCLKVENNFLHPCIWSTICTLEPQRLTDMAAHCFAKHRLWERYCEITLRTHEILWNSTTCDCCMGPLYGKGLEFICVYKNNYGLRLPYLFHACSPTCYMDFIAATPSD